MYSLYAVTDNGCFDILPKSNNLSWNNDTDTLATELQFESIYNLPLGAQLALRNNAGLLIGCVVIKQTKKKFTNSYNAYDYAFYLNKSKATIQFNNVAASVAIQQLLSQFNTTVDICSISTNINKIYKAQEISSIISDILSQATAETGEDYIKEMIGYTLTISKLSDMKISPKIVIGNDVSLESSIEDMKNKVLVQSSDESKNTILAMVQDTDSINKYGLFQDIQTVDDKNESQAQNIANNSLKKNNKISKQLSLNVTALDGADDIKANRLINVELSDFGISGWIKIKSANHSITNNKHTVSLVFDI